MATPEPIRVAAVGDLHVTTEAAGRYRPGLQRAARESDVLLLAGDLTHMGQLDQARCLAAELRDLGRTVAVALGNHDYQHGYERTITDILTAAGIHVLEGTALRLTIRGVRVGIAGVKGGGGGFPGGLIHEFGEPEVKAFAAAGRRAAEALATALAGLDADLRIVLTHYAPVPDTLAGEPRELYPVLGNHQLGQVIDRAGGVALAVHGHAHHGSEHGTTPGGVPVRNVAQHVIAAPYRVYTLARHRSGWRLDPSEPADRTTTQTIKDTPMPPLDTTATLAADPVDDLPAAYWRILPLHAISETRGLPGLRHRLALEIADLPPEDQAVLGRAWTLAERLHRDDRRSREPYLHHILRVAIRVMSHFRVRDRDVIAAALLHDAVEDHAVELAASMGGDPIDAALVVLDRQFGPRVARLVSSVTNPVYDPRGDRNEHYRLHLVESLTWDRWARVIKLSDFIDNGLGVIYSTAAKARKSAAKYAPLVPDLLELVNRPDTPLDHAIKAHICGQLDQARRRFTAILHG